MVYDERDWGKVDTADSKPEPISMTVKIMVALKFVKALFEVIRKKEH